MHKKISFNRHIVKSCLLFVLILNACSKAADPVGIADQLMAERLTSSRDSAEVRQIVDTLLKRTTWKDRMQINQTYDPALVNIYLVRGQAGYISKDPRFRRLAGNCYFAGRGIIFLDEDFLRSFLQRHQVAAGLPNVYLFTEQECFLYWAIGHELGHLISGHPGGHFEQNALDRFVATSTITNQQELLADSFFVRAMIARPKLLAAEESLMISILNTEIRQKVGESRAAGVGIIYDYADPQIISYTRQPTHPEYVIRLSRMIDLSARMNADSGLHLLVGGFIQHLKEADTAIHTKRPIPE